MMNKRNLVFAGFVLFFVGIIILISFGVSQKRPQKKESTFPTPTPVDIKNRQQTEKEKPTLRQVDSTINTKGLSVVFNLPNTTSFPSSIEKVGVDRTINPSFVDQLKKYFGISGSPDRFGGSDYWLASNSSRSLLINTTSGYVEFKSKSGETPGNISAQEIVDTTIAENVASRLLTDIGIISVTPNTGSVLMYKNDTGEENIITTNPKEAKLFEVKYLQSFKGIPIYYQLAYQGEITATIDTQGKIRGVKFFYIQPTDTIKTEKVNLDQIKQNVENGNYIVANVEGDNKTLPKQGTITITTLTVGYLDDKTSGYFFPIVLFSGIVSPGGKNVSLYSLIPED
jgi:hypothetical protein